MADPRIWGSDMWASMHRISLAYPMEPSRSDRLAAWRYYKSIGDLLPCLGCRQHYRKHFNETFNRRTTDSRIALVRWVYELHELVNARLGKPVGQIALADLPSIYGAFPMRYIDQKGETLLMTPRYASVGENQCKQCDKNIVLTKNLADVVRAPPPFSSNALNSRESQKLPLLGIVAIAAACLALLAIIVAIVYILVSGQTRKRRNQAAGEKVDDGSTAIKI